MNAENFVMLAAAKTEQGDYKGAIEDLNQALRLNPNDANAYFLRGFTRSLLRDKQGAIDDYTQPLRIRSNHADCLRLGLRPTRSSYKQKSYRPIQITISPLIAQPSC